MSTLTMNAPVVGLGGHIQGAGPSLPPAKKRSGPSTKSGVLQEALDKEAAKKAAIGAAIGAAVKGGKAKAAQIEADKPLPVPAEPEEVIAAPEVSEPTPVKPEASAGVTDEQLAEALRIISLANKPQAEAIRKAACERKKVAPEGAKTKKVKELTPAQKEKMAKAAKAAETYSIAASAAMGFVGLGLAESKKMQIGLGLLSLPALRWLAKQYEGVSIPKEKRSALDIREFLRVELLTWKPKAEVIAE